MHNDVKCIEESVCNYSFFAPFWPFQNTKQMHKNDDNFLHSNASTARIESKRKNGEMSDKSIKEK